MSSFFLCGLLIIFGLNAGIASGPDQNDSVHRYRNGHNNDQFCTTDSAPREGSLCSGENDSSLSLLYNPPKSLDLKMVTFARSLISGAPTNPYPTGQQALQLPQMGLFENATTQIMEDIKEGLRYVFQTKNEWTLALTGHGHVAIDTVLDNLVEPGDIVFIPIYGMWGERVSDSATRLGGIVKNIVKPLGTTFSLEEIEAGIKEHKPKIVYLVNGESSTGVQQRVQGVGDLCRKYDCLLIVDLVATLAVVPFHFDAWNIDAAFSNNHKGLGAPVGLAPITFGPRAVEKIMSRKTKPISYRTDMKNWISTNYWNMDKTKTQTFHHSFPVLLFYALREALVMVTAEKLDVMWGRHGNATNRFYEGLKELQLEYFVPDPKDRLTGTIMLNPPKGIPVKDIATFLREKYGMDMGMGLGPTLGKAIRIAFLGPNASTAVVDQVLTALKDALIHFGVLIG